MADQPSIRLNKVLRELNISLDRAVEFLAQKGMDVEARPTTKITTELYDTLLDEFVTDKSKKDASHEVSEEKRKEKEDLRVIQEKKEQDRLEQIAKREILKSNRVAVEKPKTLGKIDLDLVSGKKKDVKKETPKEAEPPVVAEVKTEAIVTEVKEDIPLETTTEQEDTPVVVSPAVVEVPEKVAAPEVTIPPTVEGEPENETLKTQYQKLSGPKKTGQTINLDEVNKKEKTVEDARKRKRKRISKDVKPSPNPGGGNNATNRNNAGKRNNNRGPRQEVVKKEEPSEEEVQKQIRETLEKLQGKSNKSKGAKYRRDKRVQHRQKSEEEMAQMEADSKLLKVTEFITVGEVATMMDISSTEIISACMSLGIMVTMNQRLDAETLSIVADEFGYDVSFEKADLEDNIIDEVDSEEDLMPRAPIVTVMGHVDHGKTSLLDYIREENVIAGESGGITQHIGAYGVTLEKGQKITFLDTPGHEAFTAMRARGAQVTDIAIIVVAADDDIMPQTKEAISHAQAAGVPIIFAINKIDKPDANPEKIKEALAGMNLMVEEWGGKIQSHDVSALKGTGVNELLEKVLLEAELLELKANPSRKSRGTVVEAFLDKGRGYVSTVLVQNGTLKMGDYMLAGKHSGKVKAIVNERGVSLTEATPATPVSVLGLDGAPQAGDTFMILEDEKEAKQIAAKRTQLIREQSVRTQRHITLDEIGRRIALGDFKELNIILKGDVDGSVEALTDSLQKLSTSEIEINIIHKGVGAITESDVLLASASDAIVIGFNVRPMGNARTIADKEEIDIRSYSIIYDAINDIKDAMEGMLSPEMREEITGTAQIRETFKISKIGTIAGCMVTTGKILRNSGIRIIREGVVIHTGSLISLKRFKDDAKEVAKGYDCGLQIKNYNDIKIDDVIEGFQEIAVKKSL
ncbi:MAG: translation initiation factor IF-2 [Flavobacteriaceae bacterium]|jgi:translation initiation factor IF-2|nr:translation initiation factor IF-2 [Flavobacteriaceae bacterium]MBT5092176.1 translation initiation factor IF-2 [Flavobacteriaceae bacterium]MBT5447179.1 translation initiation factor IF-2 [Flavobacteriaceae bacterium]MBT5694815.1 translation initiation factor IF-2 [Flavobacteriaceae bacterium]MBT6953561.1 translation initiation factor IF-2 [Flavobacteriaceae bacterium]